MGISQGVRQTPCLFVVALALYTEAHRSTRAFVCVNIPIEVYSRDVFLQVQFKRNNSTSRSISVCVCPDAAPGLGAIPRAGLLTGHWTARWYTCLSSLPEPRMGRLCEMNGGAQIWVYNDWQYTVIKLVSTHFWDGSSEHINQVANHVWKLLYICSLVRSTNFISFGWTLKLSIPITILYWEVLTIIVHYSAFNQ